MTKFRAILVDDHRMVRAGLRALLGRLPSIEVVGEADTGNEAIRLIAQVRADIALMDISMPGLNGIEATRRVTRLHPRCRVLMLSMHDDKEYLYQSLAAGAFGYLLKSADFPQLEQATSAVLRGRYWINAAVTQTVLKDVVRTLREAGREMGSATGLTGRQREVLQLIAEGHSNKQIARALRLSVKTVEAHRAQVMKRLEIHHLAGLVRYAIRSGIISP